MPMSIRDLGQSSRYKWTNAPLDCELAGRRPPTRPRVRELNQEFFCVALKYCMHLYVHIMCLVSVEMFFSFTNTGYSPHVERHGE